MIVCIGLDLILALSLLYLRLKLNEPDAFKEAMPKSKTSWCLCINFSWYRLTIISIIWLAYDFSAYGLGIISAQILDNLLGDNAPLWVSFGWDTSLTSSHTPRCIAVPWLSRWIDPRAALGYSVFAQGTIGFIMAGGYSFLY